MISQNSFAFASSAPCSFSSAGTRRVLQLFRRADVNRRWDHVITRLTHVDVVVRVNRFARADRLSRQLSAPVGDDFIRVGVRARAGTGLKNVEREMVVQLALDHFLRCLDDERAAMRIEQTKIVIRLRCGPFDQTEGANERPGKSITADRENSEPRVASKRRKERTPGRTSRPSNPFPSASAPRLMPSDS